MRVRAKQHLGYNLARMPSVDPLTGLYRHEPGSFAQSCRWALNYLESRRVRVHPTSAFAEAISRAQAYCSDEVRGYPSRFDALHDAADLAGTDFITKALHRAVETGYEPPTFLLRELAVSHFNVLQPGHESEKGRNRVWELLIGALLREENQDWYDRCRTIDFQHNEEGVRWATDETTEWSERREMRDLASEIQDSIKRPVHVCFFMPLMLCCRGSVTPFFYSSMPISTDHPSSNFMVRMLEACNTTLGAVGAL